MVVLSSYLSEVSAKAFSAANESAVIAALAESGSKASVVVVLLHEQRIPAMARLEKIFFIMICLYKIWMQAFTCLKNSYKHLCYFFRKKIRTGTPVSLNLDLNWFSR